jgi:hypothetical protein
MIDDEYFTLHEIMKHEEEETLVDQRGDDHIQGWK